MEDDSSFAGQFWTFVRDLRSSLLFLARLPASVIGADAAIRPDFTTAARMFPVVGAIVGIFGGVALLLAWMLGLPSLVAAGLAIATTMILTGALHEDGLADFADSFGSTTREQKLAIMADSRVGTYGAAALIVSVLLRAASLAAIVPRSPIGAALALTAGEAVSRAALVRMWHDLPAARTGGLSNDTGAPDTNAMLTAIAIAVVIVAVTALPGVGWKAAGIAAVLAVLAAFGVIQLAASSLGGRTGDTLGACQQVTLAAFLVGASVV